MATTVMIKIAQEIRGRLNMKRRSMLKAIVAVVGGAAIAPQILVRPKSSHIFFLPESTYLDGRYKRTSPTLVCSHKGNIKD
jgi:hypothetical protein